MDDVLNRLDDQIDWYDRKSEHCQAGFKRLKVLVFLLSASLPVLSSVSFLANSQGIPRWILGAIGALIAIAEGIQQLQKYQENWILYRSTCETLKHEKYLFLGKAGPYRIAQGREVLLAERIESLVSQEHAKWASSQQSPAIAQSNKDVDKSATESSNG